MPCLSGLVFTDMGRIDDAIRSIESISDGTERALHVAGLISTLFKIKGVILIATDRLAYDIYADTHATQPEVELAPFAGTLSVRTILEVMRGQLSAIGSVYHWTVSGIPVRFQHDVMITYRDLCRDYTTDLGLVKFVPVEEITANCILAAVHPVPDIEAQTRARRLLVNGLNEVFSMNWTVLHALCHRPDYRVGDELAQMRITAKKDVDEMGTARDPVGHAHAATVLSPLAETPSTTTFTVTQSAEPATTPAGDSLRNAGTI